MWSTLSINELSLYLLFKEVKQDQARLVTDWSKGNEDTFKSNKMHVKSDDQSHYTWDQFHHISSGYFSEEGPAIISMGI